MSTRLIFFQRHRRGLILAQGDGMPFYENLRALRVSAVNSFVKAFLPHPPGSSFSSAIGAA
ncbi:MAG TPA: hypothetical protein PK360_02275 [bacterium]|nr:hypothetical protein [bacterium]